MIVCGYMRINQPQIGDLSRARLCLANKSLIFERAKLRANRRFANVLRFRVWDYSRHIRKNQPRIGANPPFGRTESDLLILTLAIQLRCLARPFIGNVRANPIAAPAAPVRKKSVFGCILGCGRATPARSPTRWEYPIC